MRTTRTAADRPTVDDTRAAVEAGLRILARVRRTESDIRERLAQRFSAAAIDAALSRLHELGYVDDHLWALDYVARERSSTRSTRLLRQELRTRNVPEAAAEAALATHDDCAAAEAAARHALRRLGATALTDPAGRRRLISSLGRRGFAYGQIDEALRQCGTAACDPAEETVDRYGTRDVTAAPDVRGSAGPRRASSRDARMTSDRNH